MGKIIATEVVTWPNERPPEHHADNPVIVNTYGNGPKQQIEIEAQRANGFRIVVTRLYLSRSNTARLIAQLADALEAGE